MPLYKYRCSSCENTFEELRRMDDRNKPISCPECGANSELTLSPNAKVFPFEPQFFDDLDVKPVWIRSKAHLKEECRKRGMRAICLT